VVIGDGAVLGSTEPLTAELGSTPDSEASVRTQEGLTVVGRNTRIPSGFHSRRPTMIDSYLDEDAVRASVAVASGDRR
jgi:hypothetical protein